MSEIIVHGTPAGWQAGCRGANCANHGTEMDTCTRAWVRYCGDYGYRKRVDAGWTPEAIHEADVVEAAAAEVAERAVRDAARQAARDAAREASGRPLPVKRVRVPGEKRQRARRPEVELKHGTYSGYKRGCTTDEDCPSFVSGGMSCHDSHLRLARARYSANLTAKGKPLASSLTAEHGTVEGYLAGCFHVDGCPASPSCTEVSAATPRYELPTRRTTRPPREKSSRQLMGAVISGLTHGTEEMYQAGCFRASTCTVIPTCEEVHLIGLGLMAQPVEKRVPVQKPPRRSRSEAAKARAPRVSRGPAHGTMWGYMSGCKTVDECPVSPSCVEVNRTYQRDYRQKRLEQNGAGLLRGRLVHGTASGYQLGCHDRNMCPGDPDGVSCADASLAEERRRRREQGVPERAMVSAKPVIQHIAYLQDNGLTPKSIMHLSGIGHTAVYALIYGRNDRGGGRPVRVSAENAAKILAIRPSSK